MTTKQQFIDEIARAINADEQTAERLFDVANEREYIECHWRDGYRWNDNAYVVFGRDTDEDEASEVDVLLMHNRLMLALENGLRDAIQHFKDTSMTAVSYVHTELLIVSHHGIYLPQMFASSYLADNPDWQGVSLEDADILRAGPHSSNYWDTWNDVVQRASLTNELGTWRLWQDDDLFVYREKTDESILEEILDALRDTMVQEYIDKLGWNEAFQAFLSTCDFSYYAREAANMTIQLDELLYAFINEQATN